MKKKNGRKLIEHELKKIKEILASLNTGELTVTERREKGEAALKIAYNGLKAVKKESKKVKEEEMRVYFEVSVLLIKTVLDSSSEKLLFLKRLEAIGAGGRKIKDVFKENSIFHRNIKEMKRNFNEGDVGECFDSILSEIDNWKN